MIYMIARVNSEYLNKELKNNRYDFFSKIKLSGSVFVTDTSELYFYCKNHIYKEMHSHILQDDVYEDLDVGQVASGYITIIINDKHQQVWFNGAMYIFERHKNGKSSALFSYISHSVDLARRID